MSARARTSGVRFGTALALAASALWTPIAFSALDMPLVGRAGEHLTDTEDPTLRPSIEQRSLRPTPRGASGAQYVSRAQAAALAREQFGGRVLDVRWTGADYRVKLLQAGSVRIVTIADIPDNKAE